MRSPILACRNGQNQGIGRTFPRHGKMAYDNTARSDDETRCHNGAKPPTISAIRYRRAGLQAERDAQACFATMLQG